ncbi:MAG: thioredoxin family protein [Bacillaceae bacterium]|nr:thioredoxin family protein [Bacillaceae bacterium]
MLEEVNDKQLQSLLDSHQDPVVIYLYTPMCGTCKMAEKMLDITLEALSDLTAAKCNINFIPHRAEEWKVESVPCMLVVQDGKVLHKIYAFHSVDYLFRMLKPIASGEGTP